MITIHNIITMFIKLKRLKTVIMALKSLDLTFCKELILCKQRWKLEQIFTNLIVGDTLDKLYHQAW